MAYRNVYFRIQTYAYGCGYGCDSGWASEAEAMIYIIGDTQFRAGILVQAPTTADVPGKGRLLVARGAAA